MTTFVSAYDSDPLLGICSVSVEPSGLFLSSAPSTLSICAAFQTLNLLVVPEDPETFSVSWSCEDDQVSDSMPSPVLTPPQRRSGGVPVTAKSLAITMRTDFCPSETG